MEETVQLAGQYLQNTTVSNQNFQSIIYARTKTEAFAASHTLAETIRPLMQANRIISGFYTYSKPFDYYRPNNLESYPAADAAVIKEAVVSATEQGNQPMGWMFLTLSDRTVLLAVSVFREDVYKRQVLILFGDGKRQLARGIYLACQQAGQSHCALLSRDAQKEKRLDLGICPVSYTHLIAALVLRNWISASIRFNRF